MKLRQKIEQSSFKVKRKGEIDFAKKIKRNDVEETSESKGPADIKPHGGFKSSLFLLMALAFGVVLGVALQPAHLGRQLELHEKAYLIFPGDAYKRMLKLVIVPLILGASVSSASLLPFNVIRKVGAYTLGVFLSVNMLAAVTGVVIHLTLRPGLEQDLIEYNRSSLEGAESASMFLNFIQGFIPENIVKATFSKEVVVAHKDIPTTTQPPAKAVNETLQVLQSVSQNMTVATINNVKNTLKRRQATRQAEAEETNFLGILVFSLLFGYGVGRLGTEVSLLGTLFRNLNKVMLYMVSVVLWYSPIGVTFLTADFIAETAVLESYVRKYYLLGATILIGMLVYHLLILPLLFYIITSKSPFGPTFRLQQALVTAAGTCSSRTTYPVTLFCLHSEPTVDYRVASLVVAAGTNLLAPAYVLHDVIMLLFLTDASRIHLSIGDYLLIIGLSHLVMVSDLPGRNIEGSIATLGIAARAAGLRNYRGLLIQLIPLTWFMDIVKTIGNVYANCLCVHLISHLTRHTSKTDDFDSLDTKLCPCWCQQTRLQVSEPSLTLLDKVEYAHKRLRRKRKYKWKPSSSTHTPPMVDPKSLKLPGKSVMS